MPDTPESMHSLGERIERLRGEMSSVGVQLSHLTAQLASLHALEQRVMALELTNASNTAAHAATLAATPVRHTLPQKVGIWGGVLSIIVTSAAIIGWVLNNWNVITPVPAKSESSAVLVVDDPTPTDWILT